MRPIRYLSSITTIWASRGGLDYGVHMDDGETVAATTADDPSGLAAAYDTYAAPLYGYCRWMLRDPGQAAEVLRDTFAVAAAKLGGKDAGQLRAWLYATAQLHLSCAFRCMPRAARAAGPGSRHARWCPPRPPT